MCVRCKLTTIFLYFLLFIYFYRLALHGKSSENKFSSALCYHLKLSLQIRGVPTVSLGYLPIFFLILIVNKFVNCHMSTAKKSGAKEIVIAHFKALSTINRGNIHTKAVVGTFC